MFLQVFCPFGQKTLRFYRYSAHNWLYPDSEGSETASKIDSEANSGAIRRRFSHRLRIWQRERSWTSLDLPGPPWTSPDLPGPPQGTRKCPKTGFLQCFLIFSSRDLRNLFFDAKIEFFWIFARSDLRNHVFRTLPRGVPRAPWHP